MKHIIDKIKKIKNKNKISDDLLRVIENKEVIEGKGSIADLVIAATIIDPKFNRAFASGGGAKFDDNGGLIPISGFKVDGFGLFKQLEYITYLGINYNGGFHFIEVEGSIMEDRYKLTFFKTN